MVMFLKFIANKEKNQATLKVKKIRCESCSSIKNYIHAHLALSCIVPLTVTFPQQKFVLLLATYVKFIQ